MQYFILNSEKTNVRSGYRIEVQASLIRSSTNNYTTEISVTFERHVYMLYHTTPTPKERDASYVSKKIKVKLSP
jgi:hypothetical protein